MAWANLLRITATAGVLGVGLGAVTGCRQNYNGSWGLTANQTQAATDYAREQQQRDQRLATARDAARPANHHGSAAAPHMANPYADAPDFAPANAFDDDGSRGPVFFAANHPGLATAATPPTRFASQPATPQYMSDDHAGARGGMPRIGLFGSLPGRDTSYDDGSAADNMQRVTFTTEGGDFDVTTDPTGKNLVFASTRHRETSDIYLKHVGGTAVTQLTNDPADDVMPDVSPDGRRVAFASDRGGNWDIYIMPIDGGPAEQVTSGQSQDIHPSFSPDGRRLVYASFGAGAGQWELVLVDLAHPGKRTILGPGLFPQWSPRGDKILFQRARQRGTHWFSVWTVDLENGQAMRPTELAASQNAAVITPAWSPDGQHIVFCTVIDPGADNGSTVARPTQADVWIMRADGSGRARLTGGRYANLQPTWAGDGSIFFVSNRATNGIDNLWRVRPERAVSLADSGKGKAEAGMMQAEVPTGGQ